MQGSIMSTAEAVRSLPRILTGLAGDSGTCYITDGTGRARAVLLDIDKYNAMMDAIEAGGERHAGAADAEVADALVKAIIQRSKTEQ